MDRTNRSRRAFFRLAAGAGLATMLSQRSEAASPAPRGGEEPADIPGVEHAMTVMAHIDPVIQMGKTPTGDRRVITISGGSFEGPKLKGVVMPGGEDWQLTRPDGVTAFEARYLLRADDGALIKVFNRAISAPGTSGSPAYLRTSPEFEAPMGPHDWLNKALFVGTLSVDNMLAPKVVTLRFYKVT